MPGWSKTVLSRLMFHMVCVVAHLQQLCNQLTASLRSRITLWGAILLNWPRQLHSPGGQGVVPGAQICGAQDEERCGNFNEQGSQQKTEKLSCHHKYGRCNWGSTMAAIARAALTSKYSKRRVEKGLTGQLLQGKMERGHLS